MMASSGATGEGAYQRPGSQTYSSHASDFGFRGDRAAGEQPKTLHFKLVLLGDTSVGKSCLVVRFAKDEFYEYQESTIGAAFMTQSVDLGSCIVKFEIWDTAGQERYRSLAPMYYRGAAAAVVVYDISNRDSFQGAKSWIQELQTVNDRSNVVIALAGNKEDLTVERQVPKQEAQQYADEHGILFLETSAKTGHNVNELFYEIAALLPKTRKEHDPHAGFQLNKTQEQKPSSRAWCACGGGRSS